MKKLAFLFMLNIFIGCNNPPNSFLSKKIKEIQKKEIIFPCYKDLPTNVDFKVVTLINGKCGGCLSEINYWKNWIGNTTKKVTFIFYVSEPSQYAVDYLESVLNEEKYILKINKSKKFLEMNNINEEDQIFHTMILNKKNRVLFVGNPLYNEELKKIYNKLLLTPPPY